MANSKKKCAAAFISRRGSVNGTRAFPPAQRLTIALTCPGTRDSLVFRSRRRNAKRYNLPGGSSCEPQHVAVLHCSATSRIHLNSGLGPCATRRKMCLTDRILPSIATAGVCCQEDAVGAGAGRTQELKVLEQGSTTNASCRYLPSYFTASSPARSSSNACMTFGQIPAAQSYVALWMRLRVFARTRACVLCERQRSRLQESSRTRFPRL